LQPFIENAIWHGIMPKEDGGVVTVTLDKTDNTLKCIIDDNGIGREISKQNKFLSMDSSHQSKGEHLTQARLNLDNLLNERNASVQLIDKKDEHGNPSGTVVVVAFNEY
jgi:sensor histidine kinase YesM